MSGRQTAFVNDEMTALRGIMARNGFGVAANNLRIGDVRDVHALIRTWQEYPKAMEHYPLRLSKRYDKFR